MSKLTAIIIIISLLQVSASTRAQKITLNAEHVSLEKVLKTIKSQSGYVFFYASQDVKFDITVHVSNVSITEALDACFKNTLLSYKIADKTVLLQKRTSVPPGPVLQNALKAISGEVRDENDKPLPGVTIIIKGTHYSTLSDEQGNFRLNEVPPEAIVRISYVGYLSKELQADSDFSHIKMEVNAATLDQVQVIAYGTTTQRLSTGDVKTVSAKEIDQQPVNNPLLALEGRVPGLFITQTTGFAGTSVAIQIQGKNSLANGTEPLYVIDGVPYGAQSGSTIDPYLQNGLVYTSSGYMSPSPLNFINPKDIESISILKDADATSIYGSRAANGAILISTKKGKAGRTLIDFNLQGGLGKDTRRLELMNTRQYLQMRNEAFTGDGLTPGPTDYDLNGTYSKTSNTNWQNVLLGGTARYTDLQGSISGGSALTQFFISTNYHHETSVFPISFGDSKGSIHLNINSTSANKKFKVQLSANEMFDNNNLPGSDITNIAVTLAPNAPAQLYNKDGSLNWAQDSDGNSTWYNPLAALQYTYIIKTNNLLGNLQLSYEVLPGLELKSSFGYNNVQDNETFLSPSTTSPPENGALNSASFGNSNVNSWIIEPQVTYGRSIGPGTLEAIVGSTIEQNNALGQVTQATGFNSPLLLRDVGSASSVKAFTVLASIYKYNAVFGRLNYNWDEKYIVSATVRRDGSSRFGADNQFHNFGSIGGAWILSKERWFIGGMPFLSFAKLRASYGSTGSDQIGDYTYLSLYKNYPTWQPYQGVTGIYPGGLTNPYLQWEATKKTNVGLDLGFFKDRLLFSAVYYLNRSSNQLLSYALPSVTGFNSIAQNLPATLQNYGWEFSLASTNIKSKNFTWTSNLNLTIPENKLVSFPGLASSAYAETYVIGKPVTIQKVFHLADVNSTTGLYEFTDATGKLTSAPIYGVDNNYTVNTAPRLYGGFQNSFSYRGFRLDVLLQFVKQTGQTYKFGSIPGYFDNQDNGNQPLSILKAWKKPGDKTDIQRTNTDFSADEAWRNAAYYSDAAFGDASYIRLKNLSFSWNVPAAWLKRSHLSEVRLFAEGQNVLTLTSYKGLDPGTINTVPGGITLPPLKVFTFGIEIIL